MERQLTHDSMSTHEPDGTTLCIHSVCVAQPHRRRGVASAALRAYINYVRATSPHLRQVRLISKQYLVRGD
eukprot:351146-Chlamydomonas_euryale.AAC.1